MSDVIIPCLESNSTRVRQIAARVLGSAVQNNGMVQILALESGVIPYLLRTIALEKSFAVCLTKNLNANNNNQKLHNNIV